MAIVMRQELPGMTREQAAAIAALVNENARTAPGFIAHASGPIAGGYQVTEIWESREAFERYSEAVIAPLMGQLGVAAPVAPPQYLAVENLVMR